MRQQAIGECGADGPAIRRCAARVWDSVDTPGDTGGVHSIEDRWYVSDRRGAIRTRAVGLRDAGGYQDVPRSVPPPSVPVAIAAPSRASLARLLRSLGIVALEAVHRRGTQDHVPGPGRRGPELEGPVGDREVLGQRSEIRYAGLGPADPTGSLEYPVPGQAGVPAAGVTPLVPCEAVHASSVDGPPLPRNAVVEVRPEVARLRHGVAASIRKCGGGRPVALTGIAWSNDSAGGDVDAEETKHVVEAVVLLVDDHDVTDRASRLGAGSRKRPGPRRGGGPTPARRHQNEHGDNERERASVFVLPCRHRTDCGPHQDRRSRG